MSCKLGVLYVVATPIGNLSDLSPRALATLSGADLIAAEDTRHSSILLKHFSITTPIVSLHEYSGKERVAKLLARLQDGNSIALISDAGTPLISDPGYSLLSVVRKEGIRVVPIPGPCAAIAALSVAGLPANGFIFTGFLSSKSRARQEQLAEFAYEPRTVIIYEAPHRILDFFSDLVFVLGGDRYVVVARELTKMFETIYGGQADEVMAWLRAEDHQRKGEFVVLVEGNQSVPNQEKEARRVLELLLAELSPSQAVGLAAKITGERKKKLYQWSLQINDEP